MNTIVVIINKNRIIFDLNMGFITSLLSCWDVDFGLNKKVTVPANLIAKAKIGKNITATINNQKDHQKFVLIAIIISTISTKKRTT